MKFMKTMMTLAVGGIGLAGATGAQAIATGGAATGTFDWGAGNTTTLAGSWFSMLAADVDEDMIPETNVYTGLRGAGTTGTNFVTAGGTLNFGLANAAGTIDRPWSFFNAAGTHWNNQVLEVTVVDANTLHVNMAGWTVNWNGGDIDMGAGGPAVISNVDGIWNNGNDTLDYSAVVPSGGFAGVQYALHLQGSMAPVPEASTYGMMLAGLGLVGFAVRRRKQSVV
ncbi:PEP-CTERM sorting domain-containing protein [Thiobacillus sp.]|uniref:PEP-CTERM sorting domain-containing protein n=1 Tax=Thiobacillus sp. TaxID=924 RepID=UPI0025DD1AFC|nr:PEP-CTERM sorting domain-containing protein [Thiobacillus sp.]